MGINSVHEAPHLLYIKQVYHRVVADTFLGDDLSGTCKIIPIEEIVDNGVKRVQKLTAASKAFVGQSVLGSITSGRRGGGRRGASTNN